MRVLSLNCWCGKALDPLLSFIRARAPETDIFCFQEVFSLHSGSCDLGDGVSYDLFSRLTEALPDFQGFYAPLQAGYELGGRSSCDISLGLAMFVGKAIRVERHGDEFVFRERNGFRASDSFALCPRTVQYAAFRSGETTCTVCNFHGLATWPKTDTPERHEQAERLRAFLDDITGPTVLCGDFNMRRDTESMRRIAGDMRDLTHEYGVETTRSPLSVVSAAPEISDFILVSPDVRVVSFEVLDVSVSDHLPLALEFA